MREILFRGKRVDKDAWVHGDLCRVIDGDVQAPFILHHRIFYGRVIPESIGQFTGLYDSAGNKIFEGDILVFDGAENKQDERAAVVFDDGKFKLKYFKYSYLDDLDSSIAKMQTVVGNVYDQ